MSVIRRVIPPPTLSRATNGCADLTFFIRWGGTHLVFRPSTIHENEATASRDPVNLLCYEYECPGRDTHIVDRVSLQDASVKIIK